VICGCRPGIGNSEQFEVHWRQQVYGSNANSSQLFYAVVEGDSAVASARQLGLSALVDTLTMGVRLSAGESGSSDSLRVQRPGAAGQRREIWRIEPPLGRGHLPR